MVSLMRVICGYFSQHISVTNTAKMCYGTFKRTQNHNSVMTSVEKTKVIVNKNLIDKDDSSIENKEHHPRKWSEYYVPEPGSPDYDEWNNEVIKGLKRLKKFD